MPIERIQRRVDALLDQAEAATDSGDWPAVAEKASLRRGRRGGTALQHRLEWASRPDVCFGRRCRAVPPGLADVAGRRGDIEAAREHLDAAGAFFAQHGAKLYLDQVLAKKQFRKA